MSVISLLDLETPAVVVDEDIVDRNIAAAQAQFDRLGVALRPHVKTHKLVRFARKQLAAGAVGITCQKTSEAEVFARAGCGDITITYNIIGAAKLARLRRLTGMSRITVVADSELTVAGLSATFADSAEPLPVLVECDTGGGRCGVASPEAAAALARFIAHSPGLTFAGLMTYPAPFTHEKVEEFLHSARDRCIGAAGSCAVVSSGGTPSMTALKGPTVITEYRPGTYIYNDRSLVMRGACGIQDCAVAVRSTVVSRPAESRAIIDAGSKTLSSDLMGLSGHGLIREYPEARITGLSEEHGMVDLSVCAERPGVGDVVSVIPNHVCVVTNLFDRVHLHRSGRFVETVEVDARGCVF